MACGSLVQTEQIYLNLQLWNEQPGVDSRLYRKHSLCCRVRQGRGTLVELKNSAGTDQVPEVLESSSGAHSHSAEVCVVLKQIFQCTDLKVVSIWAQVTCGLVAAICLNLWS